VARRLWTYQVKIIPDAKTMAMRIIGLYFSLFLNIIFLKGIKGRLKGVKGNKGIMIIYAISFFYIFYIYFWPLFLSSLCPPPFSPFYPFPSYADTPSFF